MARKDRKDKKKEEDFSVNPFKALKGFAVEGQKKPADSPEKSRQRTAQEGGEEEDDAGLFTRRMKQLGVETIDTDGRHREIEPSAAPRPKTDKPKAPQSDEDLFRRALGNMDVCFRDGFPEENRACPAPQPRRMKQVRRGTLKPEARLDLHGLTRREAVEKVGFFLQDCMHQGIKTVLLITGRGYGSQEGPILRPAIEKYLDSEGRIRVAEWGRAPKQYGGEGALVVFLRGREI